MVKFNFTACDHSTSASGIKTVFRREVMAVAAFSFVFAASLRAQVPSVLWRTNVNATLFAVDSQTNVYANRDGMVITLNSQGVPFQTNSLCPVPSIAPGFALSDYSGNIYFAGNFDGTNDFGGKIIVGGWTNNTPTTGKWQPGYPTGFLAKYAANGALLWATRIDGLIAGSNVVSDLVLNPDNSVVVGIYAGFNFAQIVEFSSTGSNLWQNSSFDFMFSCGPVKLSGLRGTNGGFLLYKYGQGTVGTYHYTSSGAVAVNSSQPITFNPTTTPNGKPVTTLANQIYTAGSGQGGPGSNVLQKAVIGGSVLWSQPVGGGEQWLLNDDNRGHLYLSGTDGSFSEYDSSGTLIWTNNYSSPGVFGLSDLAGNRIVQFADNTIALISADPGAQVPQIHLNPQAGDGATSAGFQFTLSAHSGSSYQVIWTTNFSSWQSMGYVTNTVVDSDATNHLQKFYQLAP
jgi:hypothetical protein